uniref:Uncharacterized protein n=1 Tax=Aegilops tauschii TaxID=37682 RepID=R7WA63_AEGTA
MMMVVWFEEFQTFKDKTSAINPVTGVNEQLTTMIQKHIEPKQKIAVGKLEYKDIIEDKLGISCLFDGTIMELMWGLKNCMQYLVPEEKSELTKEDRLHMSEGMKILLRRYKIEVELEMVNKLIIEKTGILYSSDVCVNKHSDFMRSAGEHLKKISDIDSRHWGLVKIAAALKILCYPDEGLPGDPRPVFSRDEFFKLVHHGPLYEGKILKVPCKIAFDQMVSARGLRNKTLPLLAHYVREAREAYEADQALMSSS